MRIRRATRRDVDAITQLYATDAIAKPSVPTGHEADAFDEIDASEREVLLVAEREEKVIGTLQITFLRYLTYGGARVALIEAVHVAESERNRGVGAELMRYAIAEARRRGCHRVQLTSNKVRKDAHRFYERLGFTTSHEGMKLWL